MVLPSGPQPLCAMNVTVISSVSMSRTWFNQRAYAVISMFLPIHSTVKVNEINMLTSLLGIDGRPFSPSGITSWWDNDTGWTLIFIFYEFIILHLLNILFVTTVKRDNIYLSLSCGDGIEADDVAVGAPAAVEVALCALAVFSKWGVMDISAQRQDRFGFHVH